MEAQKIDKKEVDGASHGYTEPLGLMAQLQRPSIKLDVVPVLDLLLITLLFSLLFTRFVMVPGVRVDLPDSEMQMQPSNLPVAVLTIGNRGMLFFDGAVFELSSIQRGFQQHIQNTPAQEVVLLVKTEGSMDLQLFLKLCRMAQDAGFVQVQVAGEREALPNSGAPLPAVPTGPTADSGFLSVM
ncbi:biopolymer transporter ExbD [Coraliomargarita sp. SDUM461004]|uniref:Biopolymer transporter ExbD n=1 Tax=Thalassobacterium sedimentorum TaxID=3041258 RepID=A0ABU1AK85_9BACT|nr:biopolymer transporter ExbD [Coraliomargarita sp. SDUM461004]MDQ8195193.1 biopolymer transporter ExbD [Coraliomargarita sp. SDUM461004]